MSANSKKFVNAGEDAADAFLTAAQSSLRSTERFTALNLNMARAAIENATAAAKALLSARTPEEAMKLPAEASKAAADQTAAYAKSLYDIATQAQQEMLKLSETRYLEFQNAMSRLLDEAAQHAPAGSEAALTSMRNAMSTANAAFDTLTAAARQLATAVQTNISDLGESAKKGK